MARSVHAWLCTGLSVAKPRSLNDVLCLSNVLQQLHRDMAEALPVGASTQAAAGGYNVGGATVYNKHGPLIAADLASVTCSRCKLILREPQQITSCGHRYCKVCIDQLRSVR